MGVTARSPAAASFGPQQQALVFAAALLPRLAHFLFVRGTPLADQYVPDLSAYLFVAQKMVGSAFFFTQPMLMSPGYSLVIAPVLATLGPDIPALVLMNALFDAGSAALCAGLAARAAPAGLERRAGLAAGLLYALCGPLLFYALLPLAEGPAIFCLLASLTLLLRPAKEASGRSLSPYLGGALFALAALLRPNLTPAGPLAALAWCLPRAATPRSERLHAAGRFLAGVLLALLPFMGHNLATEGRATPFGFQGGFTFHTGNHKGASGVGDTLPGFSNTPYLVIIEAWGEASRRMGRQLSLVEADAYWYGQGLRFFAEQPGEAARLLGKKALLLLNAHGRDASVDLDFSRRFSPVPGLLALPLGVLHALAALGLWRRAGRTPEAAALAVALGWGALSVALFQVTPRYRSVLLPLTLCFAALALAELPELPRQPRKRLLAPALLLATTLVLAHVPLSALGLAPSLPAQEFERLGRFYLMTGRQPLAREALDAALALPLAQNQAEELRRMRRASLALEGKDGHASPEP